MERKKSNAKRFLSILLTCLMIFTLPSSALASDLDFTAEAAPAEVQENAESAEVTDAEVEEPQAEEPTEDEYVEEEPAEGSAEQKAVEEEDSQELDMAEDSGAGAEEIAEENSEETQDLDLADDFSAGEQDAFNAGEETTGTAAAPADVYVTISNKGVLAKTKDNQPMAHQKVTVKDLNSDGVLTYDEALVAAHEAYAQADGYVTENGQWGLTVKKLWGIDTTNTLYYLNGAALQSNVGDTKVSTVKANDYLVASINQDDVNYSDKYASFDAVEKTVKAGEEFTLTLNGAMTAGTKALSGIQIGTWKDGAYKSGIVNTVKSKKGILHEKKYTEYSRVILALTAIGEDVTDVGGYNLLQPLSDFKQTVWQGVNGAIWALIAFDSKNYAIPKAEEGKTQNSREMLINHILEEEVKGGGWSIYGAADTDVTAMAIQALAPYYKTNSAVKAAVDRGLTVLSNKQEADGGFGTWGTSTSESCAQVVVALSAMGIDANTDKRFVKNGKSALQGLLNYAISTGGFKHVSNLGYDQMATEQGYYALTAYSRFKNGENSLYDMTDVPVQSDHEKANEVIKAIDNLPETVTLDNMETVKTTYAAYNSLNTAQKTLISKARKEKLTKAMASIESLEIEKVEKLIAAIGTVTLDKEEAIRAAKVAYYSLSTAQQKKVKNFSTLEAAEKELNKLKYQAGKPTPTPGSGKTPGGSTHLISTPTPTPKATQKPASKTTPTPKAAKTPAPTPTTTPSAEKKSGKSAGGSTKSMSTGNSKSAKSGKSSAKTDAKKSASSKNSKNAKNSSKTGTASAKTTVKAEKTKASDSVLKKIKAFFRKDGSTYISRIKDFSDREVNNILKVYKQYEKLSAGEKAAVQEDSVYKPYEELLKNLGTRNHFDQATGAQVSSEKDSAFPWYVQLKVNPELVTDKQMETIKKALGDQAEVFSLNEIHFVDTLNGDAWEPKDVLKVELPMVDLGDYESCMIVHITDKGKVEFLNGKVSGNIISFEAAEFSSYGIVGFMGSADDLLKETDKKQPVWPWAAGAGAALLLAVILGGVQLAGSRKAKADSGKKKDKSEK